MDGGWEEVRGASREGRGGVVVGGDGRVLGGI